MADKLLVQWYFYIAYKLKPPSSNDNLTLAKKNLGGPFSQIYFLNKFSIYLLKCRNTYKNINEIKDNFHKANFDPQA